MSERLSDELVANLAVWAADAKPTTREVEALAREVQEWRSTYIESGDDLREFLRATDVTQTIDALCDRHGITVEGIVALVDEVMKSRPTPSPANLSEAIEACWGNSDDLYYAGWEVGYHDAMLSAWALARGEEA